MPLPGFLKTDIIESAQTVGAHNGKPYIKKDPDGRFLFVPFAFATFRDTWEECIARLKQHYIDDTVPF